MAVWLNSYTLHQAPSVPAYVSQFDLVSEIVWAKAKYYAKHTKDKEINMAATRAILSFNKGIVIYSYNILKQI